MKLRLLLRGLALLAGLALGVPSAAADVAATATYAVTLSGTAIATVTITLDDRGGRYAMALDARVTGLGTLVATGIARAESQGMVGGSGLAAQRFYLLTRSGGEDFEIVVEYADRAVKSFVVTPPIVNNIDRVAIERKHLGGVTDMLAAFVVRAPRLGASVCDRRMQVFTGIERFDLAMSFAQADEATSPRTGYQGPVVLCNLRYKPISGHFTTSEITQGLARSDRIHLWYAPLGGGYFIPYRALLATAVGDLSIVLTRLEPR